MHYRLNKFGVASLAFGHLVVDLQSSALAVMIPIIYANFNLDYGAAALIITLNNITSALVQPLFGAISDRRSLRWLLPLGCLVTTVGIVMVLYMPSYWLVLLVVTVSGLGSAAFHPEAARNANHLAGNKKATGLSVYFVGGNLGYAVGPLLTAGLITWFGTDGILGLLLPGLVGTFILLQLQPLFAKYAAGAYKASHANEAAVSHRKILKPLFLLLGVIIVRSMISTGLVTFIPLYFTTANGTPDKDYSSFLLSVFVFSGAIGTLIGGPLSDRIDRKIMITGSFVVVIPFLFLFLNSSGIVQVASIAVAGTTLIAASSLTVVMAQELLPNNVGMASGLTLGLAFGAGGIGAAGLGKYADVFGLTQTMVLLALLPVLAIILAILFARSIREKTAGENVLEPGPGSIEA